MLVTSASPHISPSDGLGTNLSFGPIASVLVQYAG